MNINYFCEEMRKHAETMKKVSVVGSDIWQAPDDPELFSINIVVITKSQRYLVISHHQIFYNCMSKTFVDVSASEPDIELTPVVKIKGYDVLDFIPDECIDYSIHDETLINQANKLVEKLLGVTSTIN